MPGVGAALTSGCKVPVADCRNLTRKRVLTRAMEDASDIVVEMRKIWIRVTSSKQSFGIVNAIEYGPDRPMCSANRCYCSQVVGFTS